MHPSMTSRPIMEAIGHVQGFLEPDMADAYFQRLQALPWQKVMWRAGRYLPRLVYSYESYDPVINELIELVESHFSCRVKGVWGNYYRDGNDYTPEHQDSYGGHVITLSFGAPRLFYLRHLTTNEKIQYTLNHGDVNWFSPEINAAHKHAVPKSKQTQPRISMVFFTH